MHPYLGHTVFMAIFLKTGEINLNWFDIFVCNWSFYTGILPHDLLPAAKDCRKQHIFFKSMAFNDSSSFLCVLWALTAWSWPCKSIFLFIYQQIVCLICIVSQNLRSKIRDFYQVLSLVDGRLHHCTSSLTMEASWPSRRKASVGC